MGRLNLKLFKKKMGGGGIMSGRTLFSGKKEVISYLYLPWGKRGRGVHFTLSTVVGCGVLGEWEGGKFFFYFFYFGLRMRLMELKSIKFNSGSLRIWCVDMQRWWWWSPLYSTIFHSSRLSALLSHVILNEWLAFYSAFGISAWVMYLQHCLGVTWRAQEWGDSVCFVMDYFLHYLHL